MSIELSASMVKLRSESDRGLFMSDRAKFLNDLSAEYYLDYDTFPSKQWNINHLKTCLFDDLDLLDALKAITSSSTNTASTIWSAFSVSLQTLSLEDLKFKFHLLTEYKKHIEMDVIGMNLNQIKKHKETILQFNSGESRKAAVFGIQPCFRPTLWSNILETDSIDERETRVKRLTHDLYGKIAKYDLLIDRIIQIDSKHCQNHDQFFVFEEVVRDVLLFWSRDDWIPTRLSEMGYRIETITKEPLKNNIIPIWGMSLYCMPLCYLFENAGAVYGMFRELYTRYFYKLQTVNNREDSILPLCILFENIVKERDSALYHFLIRDLEIQPISIVFKWILFAFVGVLDVEQTLLLWDRIIAYDSLDLLPLTAAALLNFRRDMILNCANADEVMVF